MLLHEISLSSNDHDDKDEKVLWDIIKMRCNGSFRDPHETAYELLYSIT
jgi:hypothetical protein